MERYCECCDDWVKGTDCPRCGAPTCARIDERRPITELVHAARALVERPDYSRRDRVLKALEAFGWVAAEKRKKTAAS